MSTLGALFAPRADPYAGVDVDAAHRLGSVLAIVGNVIALAIMLAAPPTQDLGDAGWLLVGALVALNTCAIVAMRREGSRGARPTALLVGSYVAAAEVVALQWLGDPGYSLAYGQLYLLPLLFACCTQPPRRAALFFAFSVLAVLSPVARDEMPGPTLAAVLAELVLWTGVCGVGLVMMDRVRSQRVGLRSEADKTHEQARSDPLTGLGNRRAFDESLRSATADAQSTGRPLSVIVLDVNDFKSINDRFGHLDGDRCLRDVAIAISSILRAPDRCYRWGGDEFLILLPDTGLEGARRVGERVRETVTVTCRRPDSTPMQATVGVAEMTSEMSTDELIGQADLNLLSAKSARTQGPGETASPAPPDRTIERRS